MRNAVVPCSRYEVILVPSSGLVQAAATSGRTGACLGVEWAPPESRRPVKGSNRRVHQPSRRVDSTAVAPGTTGRPATDRTGGQVRRPHGRGFAAAWVIGESGGGAASGRIGRVPRDGDRSPRKPCGPHSAGDGLVVPFGSAYRGIEPLLDAVNACLLSLVDVPPVRGTGAAGEFELWSTVVGGAVPREHVRVVGIGCRDALPLAGHPVTGPPHHPHRRRDPPEGLVRTGVPRGGPLRPPAGTGRRGCRAHPEDTVGTVLGDLPRPGQGHGILRPLHRLSTSRLSAHSPRRQPLSILPSR